MFKEFISQYGMEIINTIVVAIIGYIGIAVKNIYAKYVNTETKRDVVRTCVKAVEQIFTDIHGEDKFNKCIEYACEILSEKGITVSDSEIRMLIESAVREMNERVKLAEVK